jgi:predicted phage-related endonuclease
MPPARIDTRPGQPARAYYIGASEVPAVLGLSPYTSPLAVYRAKTGPPEPDRDALAIDVGRALEPVILARASAEIGVALTSPVLAYVSGRLAALPDGVDDDEAPTVVVECKAWSRAYRDADQIEQLAEGRAPEGGRALAAYVQCQSQMLATGARVGYVAWIADGADLRIGELTPDPEWHRVIAASVADMAARIDLEDPPPPTGRDVEALALVPRPVDVPAGLDHLAEQVAERQRIRDQIDALDARRKDIDAAILSALGEHRRGVAGDWRVSVSVQTRASLDQRALRADHPDLCDTYTRQGEPFGVLRITRSR